MPRKKATGRKQGRPATARTAPSELTEEQINAIGSDWVKGANRLTLSRRHGVTGKAVDAAITEMRRRIAAEPQRTAEEVLYEVAMLRNIAWRRLGEEGTRGVTETTIEREYAEPAEDWTDEQVRAILNTGNMSDRRMKQQLGDVHMGAPASVKIKRTRKYTAATWAKILQWCIAFEAKVRGLQVLAAHNNNFRVAGVTPEDLDGEMLARLADALQRRGAIPVRTVEGKITAKATSAAHDSKG